MPTRRDFLLASAASAASTLIPSAISMTPPSHPFANILREPDLVRCFDGQHAHLAGMESHVRLTASPMALEIRFDGSDTSWIQLRWNADLSGVKLFLGDDWERSYANLGWHSEAPNRTMPWYFLTYDGHQAHGYGVKTGAGAMCFWTADSDGISLWADIRSGGVPVELSGRPLHVASVVTQEGRGESAFAVASQLCAKLSEHPRLPASPVYGSNDWNFAYGNNSADLIYQISRNLSELSENSGNRPFSVIDEGWAMGPYNHNFGHGPWEGNPRFGDMAEVASHLKGLGVRPGIWFRALTPLPGNPASWLLSRDKGFLDPTIPEVKAQIAHEIKKFVGWGYEMIKHDYSTFDFFGRWGFQMGPNTTEDGWKPHDATKTNAEILIDLYATIREAAGGAYLIGCNTVGHLAAGTHELQRTGDDTSGRSWDRNRRMGVNTLAFRSPQNGQFFINDPDMVAITNQIPWEKAKQWLKLVSESGAATFVSILPEALDESKKKAIRAALDLASKPQPNAEPLDWTETVCPRHWKLRGKVTTFDWNSKAGSWPFED